MSEDFDTSAVAGELKRLRLGGEEGGGGKEEGGSPAGGGGMIDKAATAMTAPVRRGTSWLLQSAWESIATVWGFIFIGLPYINLHVLGNLTLGDKFFCKLGEEWQTVFGGIAGAFGGAGKGIGLIEKIALIIFDIAVFLCILVITVVILIIIDLVTGIFGWFVKIVISFIP